MEAISMYRWIGATLGLAVFSASCSFSHADDKDKDRDNDAQAVIDKAVKAMGGAEKLTKAELASWKARTKVGDKGGITITLTTVATADRIRGEREVEAEGGQGEAIKT